MWVGRRLAIFAEHRQHRGRRAGLGAHGRAELAKEQDGRRLAGVIGGLPVPGASGVGGAEGGFHGAAQDGGIDATAALEISRRAVARP